jgi:hypothetical protein
LFQKWYKNTNEQLTPINDWEYPTISMKLNAEEVYGIDYWSF